MSPRHYDLGGLPVREAFVRKFEREVERRMRRRGWEQPDPAQIFLRPLWPGFDEIARVPHRKAETGDVVVRASVGMQCTRAKEVLLGLGESYVGTELDSDDNRKGPLCVPIAPDAFKQAARDLVEEIEVASARFRPRYETRDDFLAGLRDDERYRQALPKAEPIILAVTGDPAEARDALARYSETSTDPAYPDYVERVESWLDGGPLSLAWTETRDVSLFRELREHPDIDRPTGRVRGVLFDVALFAASWRVGWKLLRTFRRDEWGVDQPGRDDAGQADSD